MRLVTQRQEKDDHRVTTELTQIAAESLPAEEGPEGDNDAVFHVADYLAHTLQKKHRRNPCRDFLADGHHKSFVKIESPADLRSRKQEAFTDLLNRRKLFQPSVTCLQMTDDQGRRNLL